MTSHQQLLRIILIVQTTLLGIAAIESLVFGSSLAPVIPGAATAGLILAIRRLHQVPAWSRRVIRVVERTILITAGVNLLLAAILNQRLLEPVVMATQIVAPFTVLRLLKRVITPPAQPARKDLPHGAH